ncbi:MAG: hypothetical protein HQ500_11795 [Flavobacteriales bacterium]|nr:hypothetical protein [Flavobacteriales bacterium]
MKNLLKIIAMDWKGSTRSPIWHRKVIVNVFLALTFIYLIGNLLVLGIFLDDILMQLPIDGVDYQTYGPSFVLRRLNRYLIYYFFLDFIVRYFMQKLPAMSIQPYLHLPIRRASLVHFMLVKTVWSPFNLIHFVLLGPFMVEVFNNLPLSQALGWISGVIAIVYFANYFLLYIKRTSEVDTRVYVGLLASLALLVGLHWYDIVDFNAISTRLFDALFLHPWLAAVALSLLGVAYYINYKYLKSNMYLSRISKVNRDEVSYVGTGILSRFGLVGRLTELEFKFIWRNKRPRSVFLITILFLGYGLFVFPQSEYAGNYLMYILFSIIITGMFMLNYGQYLLGWEGTHFDHVLTRNVSFKDYYMSKFLLFAIVSGAAMILSTPYAYFGTEILLVLFSVFLFNLGVNAHIVMFFGSMNPKKIDVTKGTVFNWQGTGAAQFMLMIPVLGAPLGLYGLGLLFWDEMGAVALIGVVGLLGLAGTRYWIQMLAGWLRRQRYEIANDFRNQ